MDHLSQKNKRFQDAIRRVAIVLSCQQVLATLHTIRRRRGRNANPIQAPGGNHWSIMWSKCEVNVRQTFAMSESQYALNLCFSASSIFRKSQKPPRTSVQFFFLFFFAKLWLLFRILPFQPCLLQYFKLSIKTVDLSTCHTVPWILQAQCVTKAFQAF